MLSEPHIIAAMIEVSLAAIFCSQPGTASDSRCNFSG
jgi:hypothetical protein